MNKGFYIVRVSSRIGKMFRTITGDYNAAAPAGKNTWVVARFAIAKANRHSVRHLRTFRQLLMGWDVCPILEQNIAENTPICGVALKYLGKMLEVFLELVSGSWALCDGYIVKANV